MCVKTSDASEDPALPPQAGRSAAQLRLMASYLLL